MPLIKPINVQSQLSLWVILNKSKKEKSASTFLNPIHSNLQIVYNFHQAIDPIAFRTVGGWITYLVSPS